MKITGKVTLLTAALFALSAHAVAAETTQTETTVQPTTAEVTTVQPTTETTTTAEGTLPKDSKNDVDIHVYKPGEEPKYTGLYKADGETYYQVDSKPITNTWKWHGGRWYYFGADGKMLKSTVTPDGYLVDIEGMLVSPGWSYQGGKWYYALSGGKVFRGDWKKIGGTWYAFHDNGVMYSHEWNGSYFLKDSGAMADNEWVFDRNYNSWFYIKPGGTYASRQWKGDYYLKAGGYMAQSEFIYDPNYKATYYLKEDGTYVKNQWLQIKGKWYHFRKYGELDTNKWIGSYYVKADGMMAENEWIYDSNYGGKFYLQADGVYARNIVTIDGKKHAFQENGLWIGEVPAPVNYGNYKNVVFLDPGHGGRDPGAVYNGLREKDLNMSIYRKLRSELEKLGYTVLTSRDSDVYVDYVTERSEMVNKTNADVFISIHFNATGVPGANRSGVETYIYEPDEDIKPRINKVAHDDPTRLSESKRLADNIHNSVVSVAGANDRGVHGSNYAVLRETVKPAVLIELGYMDSPEYKKISDDKYQNKLVEGIVTGLRNFYKTAK
ncbi:N-acetylmuramoyl-L-alanine amidase [Granulicatella sp. UMB5615B]|uniref:N-acetylmuramoyl-L-alanine amidase n=2 Tax=unclassified Granulicatella TaxID=2630493 RepID=UPI0025562B41|nr:N-acetylmuramoyl-L-alanine amidase [Granulicatella sp. UMB5615B]MDK8381059.1 N-acetylmuramoyl-L-alanine amidase [Granulicatella sp. UMB5615B]